MGSPGPCHLGHTVAFAGVVVVVSTSSGAGVGDAVGFVGAGVGDAVGSVGPGVGASVGILVVGSVVGSVVGCCDGGSTGHQTHFARSFGSVMYLPLTLRFLHCLQSSSHRLHL